MQQFVVLSNPPQAVRILTVDFLEQDLSGVCPKRIKVECHNHSPTVEVADIAEYSLTTGLRYAIEVAVLPKNPSNPGN